LELMLERADAEVETKGDSSSDEQQPTVQSASIEEKKIMNSKEEKVKLATPAVRHLAKTYGVNLADMVGSGKDGRIMKDDVLDYVASRESAIEDIQVINTLLLLRVNL
jgi:2-oxoisovalerate dehydrogenase E2 component (dihydrolipoyl transacylase)